MLENNGIKRCSSCQKEKPATEDNFCKNRCTKDGWQNVCKPCRVQINKNWRYALESGQFDKMIREQNGCCAVCDEPLLDPVIDHDHTTGKLRQILCRKCNALLGMANDNLEILKNAVAYLQRWATEE